VRAYECDDTGERELVERSAGRVAHTWAAASTHIWIGGVRGMEIASHTLHHGYSLVHACTYSTYSYTDGSRQGKRIGSVRPGRVEDPKVMSRDSRPAAWGPRLRVVVRSSLVGDHRAGPLAAPRARQPATRSSPDAPAMHPRPERGVGVQCCTTREHACKPRLRRPSSPL
jgi:hypothetical protein